MLCITMFSFCFHVLFQHTDTCSLRIYEYAAYSYAPIFTALHVVCMKPTIQALAITHLVYDRLCVFVYHMEHQAIQFVSLQFLLRMWQKYVCIQFRFGLGHPPYKSMYSNLYIFKKVYIYTISLVWQDVGIYIYTCTYVYIYIHIYI